MKRILMLFLVMMTITISADAQRRGRTVYYVVQASYSTLAQAREHNAHTVEWGELYIYKARANGKTVYRMCSACFYSKSAAQAEARKNGGWVWPSSGLARFVEGGCNYSGGPDTPLRPR